MLCVFLREGWPASNFAHSSTYRTAVFHVSTRPKLRNLHLGTHVLPCYFYGVRFTIAVKVVGTAVMHAQVMPATLSVSFLMPLVVLENAMGCKVFRDIKLDLAARNGSMLDIPNSPIHFVEGTQLTGSYAMERTLLLAV